MREETVLKGGGAVVECLKSEKVKYVFGIPGGQNLGIMDALYDTPQIRFITTHDERSAACMADGYARMTGAAGVCLATTGPGATNLLTGIGGAFHDSSPMVVLTANNRGKDLNRDDTQEADHIALLGSLTKWSKLVTETEVIPEAMREAFRRALTGSPGPVHLDFTREILEDETLEFKPLPPDQYRPVNRVRGDEQLIREATELLVQAESPTLWIGRGAIVSQAGEEILALAETLHIPVITTYNGIGSVPTDHRLVFGPRSRHGTAIATKIIESSDLLVSVGNSLNATSTSRWSLSLPDQIIHIDIEPAMIGRHYPFSVGIIGDAKLTVAEVLSLVHSTAVPDSMTAKREQRIATLSSEREVWKQKIFKAEYQSAVPIKPQFLMRALRDSLPRNAMIVGGAGNPGIWTHLMDIYETGSYMKPVGFGNMGFALPGAIAAKLAYPDRCSVCIIGDGSLGMCISEIETAVREKAPVIIVVMNNASYGNIKQEQLTYFGPRYLGVDFTDIQYAQIAKGFGGNGARVEAPGEIAPSVARAAASNETYLLDVIIDPEDNVWTDPF